uniref:Uncharacterized protein n=1 Tax=Arundo donax TaxID=35708 RepID=A0A0A9ALX2_ARUDO
MKELDHHTRESLFQKTIFSWMQQAIDGDANNVQKDY